MAQQLSAVGFFFQAEYKAKVNSKVLILNNTPSQLGF